LLIADLCCTDAVERPLTGNRWLPDIPLGLYRAEPKLWTAAPVDFYLTWSTAASAGAAARQLWPRRSS